MKQSARQIHFLEGLMLDHRKATRLNAATRYVLGELSPAEQGEFEEHFFSCVECADDVRALTVISCGSKTVLRQMPDYGESAARGWRNRGWLQAFLSWRPGKIYAIAPVFAVLLLTAVTIYQSISLRRHLVPQAVRQFALHPDVRGAETAIQVQQLGPFFVLAADTPHDVRELQWRIHRVESPATLMQGTAPGPPPGAPLTLLIPTSKFRPGQYVLAIRPQEAPSENTTEVVYRFRMH
jgi:anti-sigma factor RsiW